jgi:hypothetical protein
MSELASHEQLFKNVVANISQREGGQELLHELALGLLPPAEQYLVAVAPILYDPRIEPVAKKDDSMRLLLILADWQVEQETDKDSPWAVEKGDDEKERAHKAGIRNYMVLTRVVEILRNRQTTLTLNETEAIREMDARRIDLFPPDGEWKDLTGIIKDLAGGKTGSRAHDIMRMTGAIGRAFEDAGVDAKQIAEIIQAHSDGRNDGTSILAPMASAASKVLKDRSLTPEEKKEKLREIAANALVMGVNELESRYYNRLVPRLSYQEQTEDDGSTLFVFYARTVPQADLLRSRMQDAMIRVDDLGGELFRPISPGRILKAKVEGDWDGLLKSVVLADRACRVVYGMIAAGPGPFDHEHFMRYTNFPPREIDQALGELEKYGLVRSWKIARTKPLWEKV